MNKAAMVTHVAGLLGRSGYTTAIGEALDLALEEIGRRHDFREMIDFPTSDASITVVKDASYATITSGYLRLKSVAIVRNSSVYHVDIKTHLWMQREFPTLIRSNYVGHEDVDSGKFYFRPDPIDGDKARFVTSLLATWTATNGDHSQVIAGIDRVLIAYAAAHMFEQLEIPLTADRWWARYELTLQRAISADMRQSLLIKPTFAQTKRSEIEELLGDWPTSLEA